MRKTIKERIVNHNCSESNCSITTDDCGCSGETSDCGDENKCATKESRTRLLMKPSLRNRKSFVAYLEKEVTAEKRRLFQNTSFDYYKYSNTTMSTSANRVNSLSPQITIGKNLNSADCQCKESSCQEKDYVGMPNLSNTENEIIISSLLNINYKLTSPLNGELKWDYQNKASKQYLKNGLVQSNQIFVFNSSYIIGFNPFSLVTNLNSGWCIPCNLPGCCGTIGVPYLCVNGCCRFWNLACLAHDLRCIECAYIDCTPFCRPGLF